MTPELSRVVRADTIGVEPRHDAIVATVEECTALAKRFDLLTLATFAADLAIVRDAAGLRVTGEVTATGEQACVVSAEPVAFAIREPVDLVFTDAVPAGDEVELTDLDVVPLDGDTLDLGEVAAQSLALALDPYPRAPAEARAAAARFVISETEADAIAAADKARANPFARLRPTP